MSKQLFTIPILALCTALICSCQRANTSSATADGDTLQLKYATLLTLTAHDGYTTATLADPWNAGQTLHTYILVSPDGSLPDSTGTATIIHTPVQHAVVATSVHCSLLTDLGCGSSIAGVCDLQWINLPWIQEQAKKDSIADCGNSMSPTVETIIALQPDAIFLSPFQNSGGYGQVEETGIPIIEMTDYMEAGPLARAEWMRFYGLLFGVPDTADSLFATVEANYNDLKAMASAMPKGRSVMMDMMMSGVWYVPGGQSTIGQLIADAHAGYPWSDDEHSGSLQLAFESVLEKAADSDVWLIRYSSPAPLTSRSMIADNKGYGQFKAFQTGQIYGCDTRKTSFFEDTPFHPDRLLRDLIIITHPDSTGNGTPEYFQKID